MEQADMELFPLERSQRAGTISYYFEIQRFELVQPDAVDVLSGSMGGDGN